MNGSVHAWIYVLKVDFALTKGMILQGGPDLIKGKSLRKGLGSTLMLDSPSSPRESSFHVERVLRSGGAAGQGAAGGLSLASGRKPGPYSCSQEEMNTARCPSGLGSRFSSVP